MKKLFTLLFLILFFEAFAQDDVYYTPEAKYPKGVSKITIETGLSKAENFKFCQDVLTNENVIIEVNEQSFSIKTDELNTKKQKYPYYLIFFCKDSTIVLSGKFKLGMTIQVYGVKSEDNFEPIQNKGMKGSAYEITFSEMVEFAKKLGNKIIFSK